MVALVGDLVARGKAYETSDGVYLEVVQGRRATASWRSSRWIRCRSGAGSRPTRTSGRRSTSPCGRRPRRASRAGTRRGAPGRPGWHTECVVMSLDLLGEGFDLHGGGQDLEVPAPRERAGPGGGRRQGLRPALDAQRLGRGRGHEDVQVAGQLHHAARPALPPRRPRLPAPGAAGALPLAHRGDARDAGRRREGAGPAGRAGPALRCRRPAGADGRGVRRRRDAAGDGDRPRRARRRSGPTWTTTSTRRARWPASSSS